MQCFTNPVCPSSLGDNAKISPYSLIRAVRRVFSDSVRGVSDKSNGTLAVSWDKVEGEGVLTSSVVMAHSDPAARVKVHMVEQR